MNLFVSTASGGDIAQRLGLPHYSYHFAAARFADLLTRRFQAPIRLAMPEYYATPAALPPRPAGADIHLIFRSTEDIRLLKPARNIACFAWEFPVLKAQTLPGEHPFANQRAMLDLCDEIWVPSHFAAQVLARYGLDRVHRIPAPVPLPPHGRVPRARAAGQLGPTSAATLDLNFAWPADHQTLMTGRTQTTLGAWLAAHRQASRPATVFLAVLNPEDARKNLDAMLRGFHAFRRDHPQAVLLIKAVTAASRFSLAEVAGGVIRHQLAGGTVLRDPGIAVISDYLSDAAMSALYSLADFYLCTALAEGQNLPLLEAMAHGTVAVTTANTAMADYITPDNAIVIAERTATNDNPHLAGTVALRLFEVTRCTPRDVYAALGAALAARPGRHAEAGRATVDRLFGQAAIGAMVEARFGDPAPAPRPPAATATASPPPTRRGQAAKPAQPDAACWWLEIGPLKEGNYTGISHVTAALATCLLGDATRSPHFFYGNAEIPADIVASVIEQRHGELLDWYVARAASAAAPGDLAVPTVALFPNRKTCRRVFDLETQIIHDLSTLLTPQFHEAAAIDYHATTLRDDVHSNQLTFCVSEATRQDVLRYLGPLDPERVIATPLAASFDHQSPDPLPSRPAEPFILVLGTIEPRKNIEQILGFLAGQPHILAAIRFVFLGRHGWGDSIEALLDRHGLHQAHDAGRIFFPGFVGDAAKHAMLKHARVVIYPSLFEGFGLPVLEALHAGTPCLTTRSSSLPEAGGAACLYFDPFIEGDFARALAIALNDTPSRRQARMDHARAFSWSATWRRMTMAVDQYLGAGASTHAR